MIHLWCDGDHDAPENMRRDRALLERWSAAEPPPGARAVLRLFRFRPAGITLGHAQQPERELDLERCASDGVAWAVRPTGGRAIFHAEEWTYSFATTVDDPEWGGSLNESYDRVSALILRSLTRLGVPAAGATPGRHGAPRDLAAACFASTARHEITLGGRKLVGSAQRRTARGLLQQGSVLLGPGHLRLADYLAVPEARREALRQELDRAATHAGPHLGADAPLHAWAAAIEAELGARVRRIEDSIPLTLERDDSYTSRAFSRPGGLITAGREE